MFGRKEGEWQEQTTSPSTYHTANIQGDFVTVQGRVIRVTSGLRASEDDPTHELRFETEGYYLDPVDLEKVKRMALYAAHLLRLLRAADYGDQWSIDRLEEIVATEPPYVAENRKNAEEFEKWRAEFMASKGVEPDEVDQSGV